MKAKRKTTVYWHETTYETLRRLAYERRTSINRLVTRAVESFITPDLRTPTEPRRS